MRAEDRDPVLLFAMVNSARQALEYAEGKDRDAFAGDFLIRKAVEAVLGSMGRAAAKVSSASRSAAPEVEWERMAEFGEYVLRDYDKVTADEVWTALTETAPTVLRVIEPLLPPVDANGPWESRVADPSELRLNPSPERIAEFCRKWKVDELALFGSVLRDDFGPESDVDVLLAFAPDADHSLFDVAHMQDDLRDIFGRRVDVVRRDGLVRGGNPYSIRNILGSARVIYGAAERLEEQPQ
jgi:predicted nucleotidyltransferase/uncharacterized protein with HEPN domain